MAAESPTIVVRFHSHMRTADHPALRRAVERGGRLVPVYVADGDESEWPPGPNQRRWRVASLRVLAERLAEAGHRLIIREGAPAGELRDIADQIEADAVHWNRRYRPDQRRRDEAAAEALREAGVEVRIFAGQLLHDPEAIETSSGGPYHVFTPFWRKFLDRVEVGEPLAEPSLAAIEAPERELATLEPAELTREGGEIAPEFESWWRPGGPAARERLAAFADDGVEAYPERRDDLSATGTSRLSPRLQHGEVTPRQVWHALADGPPKDEAERPRDAFLRQIVWREFSYHLLHHYPETATRPLREKFREFDWRDDPEGLERWQRGRTGYPVVDAGMRQLQQTGWMHNRARMTVASFLTKDLRIHWRRGAEWFWHHLVDADLANNTMGWQWAAGSGADAQPFFRIFNPVSQGERHDPAGAYVRRYLPELAEMPEEYIHRPWEAPGEVLDEAGVAIGEDYPAPVVDHGEAREAALEAWRRIK